MNKKIPFFLLFILIISRLSASEMLLTPFVVYDNNGNKIDINENPSEAVYKILKQYWFEELLNFSYLSEKQTEIVYTIMDANNLSNKEEKEYLFYGYVQKNEGNWFGNIKLYDSTKKKIIKEFYCSDDKDHYERFIKQLSQNIIDGLIEITGLSQVELRKERTHPIELQLPVSGYYWSPLGGEWNRVIMGIAGVKLGLDFYPPLQEMEFCSKPMDCSLMFKLEWNYGKNQTNAYPLSLNTIEVGLPFFFHFHYDSRNIFHLGFGMNYELDLMNYIPKYEDKRFIYKSCITTEIIAGYEIKLNRLINLFTEVAFDIHYGKENYVYIKPTLGTSFNLFKEQK